MTTAAIEPTLLLSMWLRAPFPFPLKLLGVAEEEEALDDALLPLELDVCALALEPVTLAAETDEEAGDDVDAELVVEDTGGPMGKAPLVPSTLLTLSIWTATRVYVAGGTAGRLMVIDPVFIRMLVAMANVLWKASLTSSKEQEGGSVGSAVQVMVIGPPDARFEETLKLLTAKTKGRKKRALKAERIEIERAARGSWEKRKGKRRVESWGKRNDADDSCLYQ
jgi:hypothetical protein